MHEKKVFVIGLGLIGGSLACTIKQEHPSSLIQGYDVDEQQMDLAESLGVIDEQVSRIEDGAGSADFIIVAAPVMESEGIFHRLLTCEFRDGAIITDVGSTKREIMEMAECFQGSAVTFIGGHPLAGSHKSGVAASSPRLFENAFYVLIENGDVNQSKIEQLKNWLSGTKATFIEMSADEHDRIVGVISHFPHIIAASLVHQLEKMNGEGVDVRNLAAGGFRDITRIASSSPAMWHDVLMHNRGVLLDLMKRWQAEMERVTSMVEAADSQQIFSYFEEAKQYRDTLPQREKGALPPLYDLYVDIPDQPGVIARVTDHLARAGISITNIRIIEMREDIIGVLRLSFRSGEDREHARGTLHEQNYKTYLAE